MKIEITGYRDYVTAYGDTFDIIAFRFYQNEKLSHEIASANLQYADVVIFDAGIPLQIPILSVDNQPDTLPPWRR